MSKHKEMSGTRKSPQHPFYFRAVVRNGTSRGINISELLKDWEQVKITVLESKDDTITIQIEDTRRLKA